MARISLFEPPEDEAAFEAAWRAARSGPDARLLRSHSPSAGFRYAELAAAGTPAPDLPARTTSAEYEPVSDDLPDGVPFTFVLVNPFEPVDVDDDRFLAAWTLVRNVVKVRPGYLGSRLHRAVDGDARFRFVNVSPWESVSAFTAAVTDPAFAAASRSIYPNAYPSLYDAVAG